MAARSDGIPPKLTGMKAFSILATHVQIPKSRQRQGMKPGLQAKCHIFSDLLRAKNVASPKPDLALGFVPGLSPMKANPTLMFTYT